MTRISVVVCHMSGMRSIASVTDEQRRENAKVEVFNAEGKGMGLKLLAPVKKGDFIMEYVGEVRSCWVHKRNG